VERFKGSWWIVDVCFGRRLTGECVEQVAVSREPKN